MNILKELKKLQIQTDACIKLLWRVNEQKNDNFTYSEILNIYQTFVCVYSNFEIRIFRELN